jgi:hypothetical protein
MIQNIKNDERKLYDYIMNKPLSKWWKLVVFYITQIYFQSTKKSGFKSV